MGLSLKTLSSILSGSGVFCMFFSVYSECYFSSKNDIMLATLSLACNDPRPPLGAHDIIELNILLNFHGCLTPEDSAQFLWLGPCMRYTSQGAIRVPSSPHRPNV